MEYKTSDLDSKGNNILRDIQIRKSGITFQVLDESVTFLNDFVNHYKQKNFDALNQSFPYIHIHIKNVDFVFLSQQNIPSILFEILSEKIENISDYSIEIIYFLILNFNESIDFFFNPPILLQQYLCYVLEDSVQNGSFSYRHILACSRICYYVCTNTNFINNFCEIGIFRLFIEYMNDSFKEKYCTEDSSGNICIEIEDYILKTMSYFILRDKISFTDNYFKPSIDIFFRIFIEENKRELLFKTGCKFLINYSIKEPTFIIVLHESKTFKRCLDLIFESELGEEKSELLSPIFQFFAEILALKDNDFNVEEEEDQESNEKKPKTREEQDKKMINEILFNLAKNINASSLLGYLIEDQKHLKDEKYDHLYMHIFQCLSNLIDALDGIPDDIVIEDEIDPISEVVKRVMYKGRNKITIEMIYFFLKFCQYLNEEQLTKLLISVDQEFVDSLILSVGSYDEDILNCLIDLIEKLLSNIGLKAVTSEQINYFINKSFSECIEQLDTSNDLSEDVERKVQNILKSYSDHIK